MPTELIYLLGAGGHAKVVLDALFENDFDMRMVRVQDDDIRYLGKNLLGFDINNPAIINEMAGRRFHLALGSCTARQTLFDRLEAMGAHAMTIVHRSASVSRYARIGDGSFVAARSILAPSAQLGKSVIVNHGAIVDHDCVVGDFSHIAPNATLAGGVHIGMGVLIGAGANILPGVRIGSGSIIGAGAVVIANVEAGETQVGIPAGKLQRK